jgi:hypothetical protein
MVTARADDWPAFPPLSQRTVTLDPGATDALMIWIESRQIGKFAGRVTRCLGGHGTQTLTCCLKKIGGPA